MPFVFGGTKTLKTWQMSGLTDYRQLLGLTSPSLQKVDGILGTPATTTASSPATVPVVNPQDQAYSDYYTALDRPPPPPPVPLPINPILGNRRMNWQEAQYQAALNHSAQQALGQLAALDPADPDHLTHTEMVLAQSPLGAGLMKDPRVAGLVRTQTKRHAELQHFFDADPQAMHDYTALKQAGQPADKAYEETRKNVALRKAKLEFVKAGGDPSDLGQFVDPQSGLVDWPSALFHLRQQEGDKLTLPHDSWTRDASKLKKQYEDLSTDPLTGDADVAAKEKWITDHGLKKDEAGWQAAHQGVMEERVAPIRKRIAEHATQAEANRFVPDAQLRQMAGLPPVPVRQGNDGHLRIDRKALQAPAQSQASQPVVVNSQAEYDALPAGAVFIDSTGKTATKRGK